MIFQIWKKEKQIEIKEYFDSFKSTFTISIWRVFVRFAGLNDSTTCLEAFSSDWQNQKHTDQFRSFAWYGKWKIRFENNESNE